PPQGPGVPLPPAPHQLDPPALRLARLCELMMLQGEGLSGEGLLAALWLLTESRKPEHVEVVRLLYGELPAVLARRLRGGDKDGKKEAAPAADSNSGSAATAGSPDAQKRRQPDTARDQNGEQGSEGKEAGGEGKEEEEGKKEEGKEDGKEQQEKEEEEGFGGFFDLEVRQDLPAGERAALEEQWRRDIVEAVEVMEAGNCGLGCRFTAALADHLASACDVDVSDVASDFSSASLPRWLPRLPTLPLLHLRLFVLTQLGLRAAATQDSLEARLASVEYSVQEDVWGLELVPGGGGKGEDRVRLSAVAYKQACIRTWGIRQRRNLRLRVVHAMKRAW
ncbi:hypothetical protein Agub_g8595, partial [Astrephomene gubernaculifera]